MRFDARRYHEAAVPIFLLLSVINVHDFDTQFHMIGGVISTNLTADPDTSQFNVLSRYLSAIHVKKGWLLKCGVHVIVATQAATPTP